VHSFASELSTPFNESARFLGVLTAICRSFLWTSVRLSAVKLVRAAPDSRRRISRALANSWKEVAAAERPQLISEQQIQFATLFIRLRLFCSFRAAATARMDIRSARERACERAPPGNWPPPLACLRMLILI
jgi:hypothetical protein